MKKTIQLYALRLENRKYYIGQTTNIERRLKERTFGKGSLFTVLYDPLEIVHLEEFANCEYRLALHYENKLTLEYMCKYGWENVRGGIFYFPDQYKIWDVLRRKLYTPFHQKHPNLMDALYATTFTNRQIN